MSIILNPAQAKGLANFFFDIAKGLFLGGLGLSFQAPLTLKLALIIINTFSAFISIKFALFLLKDIENDYSN